MVEDERYCPGVLTQLSAARCRAGEDRLHPAPEHVQHCVAEGMAAGQGDAYLDELIARFSDSPGDDHEAGHVMIC
ncbi:MAG: metal-sensing transcriptional repressor [Candidatus Dormibacteraeota bacterium]|uniref:Metal-sensing transcriptional repressor n=1 Tax=Candidatus Amunia macphersoniae TaxID=3127014 RepID=A0A934KFX2_9BACT|nr:metal-sensing transcriptional repressor [Candidatus Dormibacteraeota bacterium]